MEDMVYSPWFGSKVQLSSNRPSPWILMQVWANNMEGEGKSQGERKETRNEIHLWVKTHWNNLTDKQAKKQTKNTPFHHSMTKFLQGELVS